MTATDVHVCWMNPDAVALALRALEPEEEIAVRNHLSHCRSCRAAAHSTDLVIGSLAASVGQIDPPARLRSGIMAQVAETPQDVPFGTPHAPPPRAARPARARRRMVVLAAAAVLGLGALSTHAVQVQEQRGLFAPSGTWATLQTGAGRAVAVVLTGRAGRTVVAAGLGANQRDTSIYVLWGIDGGGPHPLGAFDVLPGTATYPLATTDPTAYGAYAVSLEPGRVMPATPTTVVAGGSVQV